MQLLSSKKFYCAFFAGFFVNTFAVPVPGFKADSSLKKFPLTANVVVKPQGTKPQLETHDPIVTMVHSITPLAVKELLSQFPEAETFLKEIKYPELDLHYEDDVKTEKDKFSFEISFTATLHGQPKKESVWPAYPDELYGDIDLDSLKTKNEFNGAITFYSGGRKAGNLGRLLKKFDHGQSANNRMLLTKELSFRRSVKRRGPRSATSSQVFQVSEGWAKPRVASTIPVRRQLKANSSGLHFVGSQSRR
ncbi:hypothetical protein EV361DRAFT_639810 [Lentinula raphanica]|nr:hypothetical protein EV361DRAFT_639810 [Lentinula raphanica]